MQKQVNPPRPFSLLVFFSFVVIAGIAFVVIPVLFAIASLVAAAIEFGLADSNVAGDLSGVVFGSALWSVASWPYGHWITTSVVVAVCTVLFVILTYLINRRK